MLSPGLCAQLACIWEVTACKPGNVHRYCDFEDTAYVDFLASAAAVAPILETAHERRVGETVLEAIRATRRVVRSNTNLGIVLLLAPLASVPASESLRAGLRRILEELDVSDARAVYEAIRLANPGGLGRVSEGDVREEPTGSLLNAMQLAADRDLIALQYVNGFEQVFSTGLTALRDWSGRGLEEAIIFCQLWLLAEFPDSLIQRKCGAEVAEEASRRARQVLEAGWPGSAAGPPALAELDAWLRADAHRRNPGSTADLVTASLFVALREGIIQVPAAFTSMPNPPHRESATGR